MPRRVVPPVITAPVDTLLPPPPPSPIIQRLRQDWRWAGISQFIWTFSDAFGLVEWDIEALEKDIDGAESALLPDLVAKLMYALTWNRQINRDNSFDHLRRQYLKRSPEGNVLGTLEDPIEWGTLGLGQKVQILWEVCEWQLEDPARFRSLLKSEEEATSWRIDPIGWDRHGHTYFLFDDNRLWIQRVQPPPPRPAKKTSLKAKRAERAIKRARPPPKKSHKKRDPVPQKTAPTPPPISRVDEVVSGPRKRTQVVFYGNLTPTVQALKRGGNPEVTPQSDRSTRSSARFSSNHTPSKIVQPPPLPLGTRVSRRLRPLEDEWQHVPDEWLNTNDGSGNQGQNKALADDDADSDLSDLTDEDVHEARLKASFSSETARSDGGEAHDDSADSPLSDAPDEPIEDDNDSMHQEAERQPSSSNVLENEDHNSLEIDDLKLAMEAVASVPEGFVEWEAVCVTLYDWRTFPERFATSKDPDERALYKMLAIEVAPKVIEGLAAKEQERIKQEAIMNRKRSSRIATRELEREEIIRREAAQREMEERMEKSRLEEARKAQEEAEMLARERAREERLREREERQAARELAAMSRVDEEQRARHRAERRRERRKRRRDGEEVQSSSDDETPSRLSGTGTPKDASATQASWELKCEVCRQTGWNVKDDADVVCCDECGRWQHMKCHDRQDIAAGRGLRDWEKVDFQCQECQYRASVKRQRLQEDGKQISLVLSTNGHATDGPSSFAPKLRFIDPISSRTDSADIQPFTAPSTQHTAEGGLRHDDLPKFTSINRHPEFHQHPNHSQGVKGTAPTPGGVHGRGGQGPSHHTAGQFSAPSQTYPPISVHQPIPGYHHVQHGSLPPPVIASSSHLQRPIHNGQPHIPLAPVHHQPTMSSPPSLVNGPPFITNARPSLSPASSQTFRPLMFPAPRQPDRDVPIVTQQPSGYVPSPWQQGHAQH